MFYVPATYQNSSRDPLLNLDPQFEKRREEIGVACYFKIPQGASSMFFAQDSFNARNLVLRCLV